MEYTKIVLKVYTDYYHIILKTPKFRCTAQAVFPASD